MNGPATQDKRGSPGSVASDGADDSVETLLFGSRSYEKAGSGFPATKNHKKHQTSALDIDSDYVPGLARPFINRGATNPVREIVVEDDDIPELRRQQGYSKTRNEKEEMKNMMSVLHHDVIGKGSINAARDVYASASAERTDEISLHIACIPIVIKQYEERSKNKNTTVRFIIIDRFITRDRVKAFCKTAVYIDTSTKLKRLLFAKSVGRKAPRGSPDDFQDLIQLVHPKDTLPSLQYFMSSAQQSMKIMFTQMYVMEKSLSAISVADVYNKTSNFAVSKCMMIFMSRNERAFGVYVLCDLRYEAKYHIREVEEADIVPRIAAARKILSDDPKNNKRKKTNPEKPGGDRLHELITRYFGKTSRVKQHHVTYKDLFGDGTDDRSPLGALLESACFRVQFLDFGFIPTIE